MQTKTNGEWIHIRMVAYTLGHRQLGETPGLFSAGHLQRKRTAGACFTKISPVLCTILHVVIHVPHGQPYRSFAVFSFGNLLCIPTSKAAAELLALRSASRAKVSLVLVDVQPFSHTITAQLLAQVYTPILWVVNSSIKGLSLTLALYLYSI